MYNNREHLEAGSDLWAGLEGHRPTQIGRWPTQSCAELFICEVVIF